jgi:hypothetical protein
MRRVIFLQEDFVMSAIEIAFALLSLLSAYAGSWVGDELIGRFAA